MEGSNGSSRVLIEKRPRSYSIALPADKSTQKRSRSFNIDPFGKPKDDHAMILHADNCTPNLIVGVQRRTYLQVDWLQILSK